jgi:hypothetical protein
VVIKLHPDLEEYKDAEVKFFYTLGTGVSRWAFIDRQLYRLFRLALNGDRLRSAVLYYKEKTLYRRVQYVDDLLEHLVDRKALTTWRKLRKRLVDDLLRVRNIFVHHPPARSGTSDGTKAKYVYSTHIEPNAWPLKRKYTGLRGKWGLQLEDLEKHAEEVEALEQELAAFVRSIAADPKRRP